MGTTIYRKGGITVRASSPAEATRKINEVKRISKGRPTPRVNIPVSQRKGSSGSKARYKVVGTDGKIYPITKFDNAKAFAKQIGGAVIDTHSSQATINKTLSQFSKSLVQTQQQKLITTTPTRLRRAGLLNEKATNLFTQGKKNTQEFRNIIREINRLGFQANVIDRNKALKSIQKSLDIQVQRLTTAQTKAKQEKFKDSKLLGRVQREIKPNTISPNELQSLMIREDKGFSAKFIKSGMGLVIASSIALGIKDAFGKDWKNLITNFGVGFGADFTLRKIGSKVLTKAVGVVAVPLVMYDLGKSFRIMTKEKGYSPAYALTRSFVSLGMAGAGAGASRGVSSIKGVKIKVPRSKVKNIQALLRKTVLGKKILKALNTKKSNIFLYDKEGIIRVNGKSKTFKYHIEGSSYKSNFFTKPTKTHRFALRDGQGITRYVNSKTLKSFRKSLGKRTFEEGFKLNKEIAIKKAKAIKVQEHIKLSKERLVLRRQQKFIALNRMGKATRITPTSRGYPFEDLRTGNIRYFKNRNQWFKAVKQQEKAIRLKKFKPKSLVPKPIGRKKFVTKTGETIEVILKKQEKIIKQDNWRIPRILRVVNGKPIFKYERVSHAVFKKWAKAIRHQNARRWKQGTLKDWDKLILESQKHANLLNQLKGAKHPKKIITLANRFQKAVKTNLKQQESLIKGELKGKGQRQVLLLKTKVVTKAKTIIKPKQKLSLKLKTKQRPKTRTVQVQKRKQQLLLIAKQKQQQKLKTFQKVKQQQRQVLKLVSKTGVIQTPKVIQSLQLAFNVRFVQATSLVVTQANIIRSITKLTQLLNQNLRKISLQRLSVPRIKQTIPRRLKHKKPNKKQQEEIKNWLRKQAKIYRPSLSAVLFNITGYAPPKQITGLEIRPILIRRRKQR